MWTYPFSALVGQDRAREALLWAAVAPSVGGVLLRGEKGTAKSTAARGLAGLLPRLEATADCPVNCPPRDWRRMCRTCRRRWESGEALPSARRSRPFITLPLGATEDMVVGTLDFETAARHGRRRLQVGVLARANRGVLYVDEVNLLEASLASLILDAAETGLVRVEREGLSTTCPSRFCLIGSMNPEEGDLGPQLLDRFGLVVDVHAPRDRETRQEVVRRRLDFEADPAGFVRRWQEAQAELSRRVARARGAWSGVGLDPEAEADIARRCAAAGVAGHRADLVLARAARARAALDDRMTATIRDVDQAAELALTHRRRSRKPEPDRVVVRRRPAQERAKDQGASRVVRAEELPPPPLDAGPGGTGTMVERLFAPGEPFELKLVGSADENGSRTRPGRRQSRESTRNRGRYIRSSAQRLGRSLALDATLVAAAPHQVQRRRVDPRAGLILRAGDIREKVKRERAGRLVVFVVDASGSMGAVARMSEAKAAVLALLGDAYRHRDRVGLVSFRGDKAEVNLPPTSSTETAGRRLLDLPTGGRTPLAAGLLCAYGVARREAARDPKLTPLLLLLTDGKPNVALAAADPWVEALALAERLSRAPGLRFAVVDTDQASYLDFGLAFRLAERLGAAYVRLDALRHTSLIEIVNLMTTGRAATGRPGVETV